MDGGFVASNLAIGCAILLGAGGGVVILVGMIAGIAGSLAAEYMFTMRADSPIIQQMRRGEIGHLHAHHEIPRAYRLR